MSIFYIDPLNGSDANTGLITTLPRKTIPLTGTLAGDTFRWKGSPTPSTVPNCTATWTDMAKNVDVAWTAGNAPFYLLDNGSTVWTPTAGKATASASSGGKKMVAPFTTNAMAITTGATAGKLAYIALGSAVDLSAFQQLSFWMKFAPNGMTGLQIKLCSDTTGDTAVNTFAIPDAQIGASINSRNFLLTLDSGGNLGSSIQSIALYSTTTLSNAGQSASFETIIACKNGSDPFTMNSLIGKGTTGETWYGIAYISDYTSTGCKIWLDNAPAATGSSGVNAKGYTAQTAGLNETLPLKKRNCFTYLQLGLIPQNVGFTMGRTGTVTAQTIFEGGYSDFSLSAPDGETWFDAQSDANTIFSVSGNYTTFKNFGFVRGSVGLSWSTSLGAALYNISANNCSSGIVVNNAINPDFKIASVNNCTSGYASLTSGGEILIDQCANNAGTSLAVSDRGNYRPWNRDYINLRNNGLLATTSTAALSIVGVDAKIYNGDITNNIAIVLWANFRGYDFTLINCKVGFTSVFSRNGAFGVKGKTLVPDYNQTSGDHRIFGAQLHSYAKSAADTYACSGLLLTNTPFELAAELMVTEVAVLAGQPITFSVDVKRTTTATSSNFILKDDYENTLVTSATTSAANNTYETITINYTPLKTGFVRVYWEAWTTASTGTNEVTIKNVNVRGKATHFPFLDFGIFNQAVPMMPNISPDNRVIAL